MDEILDQPIIEPEKTNFTYGSFIERLGALILDGIVLAPLTIGVPYFVSFTSWHGSLISIIGSVIAIAYKPFMEFSYGATLGKMALKLRVTNLEFGKASFTEVIYRNVFNIIPNILLLLISIAFIFYPDFAVSTNGLMGFTTFGLSFATGQVINQVKGLLSIIDGIMIIADPQRRSLHDRIGGTLVVKVPGY